MTLLEQVRRLITSTGWAEDKQRQWLAGQGMVTWTQCPPGVLRKAIKKLQRFDAMFPDACVDKGNALPHNAGDGDSLKIFRDATDERNEP